MNTKNLDTFITLTKYNSINAAADALFISSPALQQQINRLESEIGFKLFERGSAGIRLTPAGETFLDGVIKLKSDTESLLARCRETDSLNKSLRVGAILGLQPDLFPRVSGPFYQKYPHIVQKPVMESEEQLFSDLDRGALDVIEYFDCPRAHAAGRNFAPLFREGRDCMMSPNHPLASRETLTLDDLANAPLYQAPPEAPPLKGKHMFGVVTVGDKGQIVIPVRARRMFGIVPGSQLMVLGEEGQGIAIVDASRFIGAVEEIRNGK